MECEHVVPALSDDCLRISHLDDERQCAVATFSVEESDAGVVVVGLNAGRERYGYDRRAGIFGIDVGKAGRFCLFVENDAVMRNVSGSMRERQSTGVVAGTGYGIRRQGDIERRVDCQVECVL